MDGATLPFWTLLPFGGLLLSIAALPTRHAAWWRRGYPWVSLGFGLPTLLYFLLLSQGWGPRYLHTLQEYVSFIVLLGSLFVISGGILLAGHLAGSPAVNTALLALGTVLASVVGTTGASLLLIRPLLQANRRRRTRAHLVVFFIFLVSNIGGCLTPLGDPPLFLGYLRGVPFAWTLGLAGPWALVSAALLAVFFAVDSGCFRSERGTFSGEAAGLWDPLRLEGVWNLLPLAGIVATVYLSGRYGWHERAYGVQEGVMLILAGLSWALTRRRIHEANRFNVHPIAEVAILFAGIFATMVPALAILEALPARWPGIHLSEPWQYFWATGLLSGFLDNAPTYLSFTALAAGAQGVDAGHLGNLLAAGNGLGERLLAAISLGAVFMGAMTYIGNGPNFMVKAIAEEEGVAMPSFLGYLGWSCGILLPLFVLLSLVVF
jgi:Na+/H+ antiporter NhaD/arsenite permease-like protein